MGNHMIKAPWLECDKVTVSSRGRIEGCSLTPIVTRTLNSMRTSWGWVMDRSRIWKRMGGRGHRNCPSDHEEWGQSPWASEECGGGQRAVKCSIVATVLS